MTTADMLDVDLPGAFAFGFLVVLLFVAAVALLRLIYRWWQS